MALSGVAWSGGLWSHNWVQVAVLPLSSWGPLEQITSIFLCLSFLISKVRMKREPLLEAYKELRAILSVCHQHYFVYVFALVT